MMAVNRFFLILMLLLAIFGQNAAHSLDVRISDTRVNNFYIDALVWLLDKSEEEYRLIRTDHPTSSQVRKVALVLNDQIDVIYAGTTNELENQLQAIRFPISRGLIGSRVFIINKQFQRDYKGEGYADGSYTRFFYNHPFIKHSFQQAQMHRRRVIEIPNPYFPAQSRAIDSRYWHQE